jgi:hypothetical protein
MRRTTLLALLAALLLAAVPGQAGARQATGAWATVNVCDTAGHPNQIGVRGSMPGLKRKARMTMRFRVQYLDDGRWRFIRNGADSGQQPVATAKGGHRDSGWTFEFKPPASGGAYQLRGVVNFTWKRKGEVVKRQRRVTTGNHPGTAGADPADFSAATCAIA